MVVNHNDYKKIMCKELAKFNEINDLDTTNIDQRFDFIREKVHEMVKTLHKENVLDDEMLMKVVGMNYKYQRYSKITGALAKYFKCSEPAYAYPLFKTHKIKPEELVNTNIFDIPTILLQSAGNITTSRVTTFIEMILNPISIDFCRYKVDE